MVVMEGWWVSRVGRSKVAVGRCQDGVGSAEGDPGIPLEEDAFFPEGGKVIIWDGWNGGS